MIFIYISADFFSALILNFKKSKFKKSCIYLFFWGFDMMTVTIAIKDKKKEKKEIIKIDYNMIIPLLEYLYQKGIRYKILKIKKE